MDYKKRFVEKDIERALASSCAVLVTGPKFCGKTTTCRKIFSNSEFVLDTKEKIMLAQADPYSILIGDTPRLIDEWQNVPDIYNCIRSEADKRENKFGQFILTGSSTPASKDDIYHSGAGRIVQVMMRPFSLFESGESKGIVSLKELFDGKEISTYCDNTTHLQDIAFYICRGGWPLSLVDNKQQALNITENYCDTLFNFENSKNGKFRNKKNSIFKMILRSYARNISTEARKSTILSDINLNDDRKLDMVTLDDYLEALNDLFIIKDLDCYNPNLRSKTAIITTPTRHFVDTSIATNAMGISPNDLMNDLKSLGLFFEDFAINQLTIYSQSIKGMLRHYRDGNGLECDCIIHLKDGRYGLIEIKLGGESLINEGCNNLSRIKNIFVGSSLREPSFMMILTAVGNSYTTKNNIKIVPITLLKD